ncbi:hypothetical protein BaRGS_00009265, partial [Batillaria attramentaria]
QLSSQPDQLRTHAPGSWWAAARSANGSSDFEASRLGRRPKRLKEVSGDGSGGSRSHTGSLPPIAPYPSPQELYRMRMAELQKILQSNGTFKAELMQAFLSAAKASFQEHSKTGEAGKSHGQGKGQSSQKMLDTSGLSNLNQNFMSGAGVVLPVSSGSDTVASDSGVGGGGAGLSGVDSPASLHSPGGSYMDLSSLAALDNFLFEQGLPPTPSGVQQNSMEASPDMPALNSPFNLNNVSLDPVSNATSPLSDYGVGSPLMVKTEPLVKTEPAGAVKTEPSVKTEPVSPLMSPLMSSSLNFEQFENAVDVGAIMEEVTDAVVEAHLATTINTHSAVAEATKRLSDPDTNMPDMSKLTLDANNVWQQFMSAMVPEITKCVKFCKKLPGFVEIEQDDQIRLIKQGSFEVMLARFSMLVDHTKQEMLDPTHSVRCPRHIIRGMQMGEFLDEFFFVAAHFNPLKLTDGEIGLFTSVLIICPDRKGLKNQRAIAKIQSLFQQALYYLMKHNHPDPDTKFAQLMGLIPMFRRINEEHSRALNSIRMKSPEEFSAQFPPLHQEIYDH